MSIKVESSTDTPAQVLEAQGGMKPEVTETNNSEVEAKNASAENTEESETSEVENESEETEIEAKGDDEGDDADGDEESRGKVSKGLQKRFAKLTKDRAAKEAALAAKESEVEYWKNEAAKLKDSTKSAGTEKKAETSGEPNEDDFDTYTDYVKAVAKYEVAQEQKALETKARDNKAREEAQARTESFQSKVNSFSESHPDFHDVLSEIDHIPMSIALQQLMFESDIGPEIMYSLAQDPKNYSRINSLGAMAAAKEIGKIEDKLTSKAAAQVEKKPIKTKAPAPINPVGGKASGTKKSPDEMSFSEFKAWRESSPKN